MAKQPDQRSSAAPRIALTIAGSDSSSGAGAQADLKTFGAFSVYGLTALSCVVAERPGKVVRIQDIGAQIVREQIEVLLESFPIAAIKTGLLHSGEVIVAVAEVLRDRAATLPLVIDPVMIATSGDLLLTPEAVKAYGKLFSLAALVTPNLDEAATLLGEPIRTLEAMRAAGGELTAKYGAAFLLKGGHLAGENAIDLLFSEGKIVEFSAPFIRGVATHGTGCTYSAAITAGLASGWPLAECVRRGKEFVTNAIAQHFIWTANSGDAIHALNHWPNETV
ncbi:MAG: bifunctional hydroxymethylpyrimidine kinase/phosphomethylpyrimidine kinase [Verrucomicrobiota bacterium]